MVVVGIISVLFGIAIIAFPNLLSIMIGAFFIFTGVSGIIAYFGMKKFYEKNSGQYYSVGNYKIYKDK